VVTTTRTTTKKQQQISLHDLLLIAQERRIAQLRSIQVFTIYKTEQHILLQFNKLRLHSRNINRNFR